MDKSKQLTIVTFTTQTDDISVPKRSLKEHDIDVHNPSYHAQRVSNCEWKIATDLPMDALQQYLLSTNDEDAAKTIPEVAEFFEFATLMRMIIDRIRCSKDGAKELINRHNEGKMGMLELSIFIQLCGLSRIDRQRLLLAPMHHNNSVGTLYGRQEEASYRTHGNLVPFFQDPYQSPDRINIPATDGECSIHFSYCESPDKRGKTDKKGKKGKDSKEGKKGKEGQSGRGYGGITIESCSSYSLIVLTEPNGTRWRTIPHSERDYEGDPLNGQADLEYIDGWENENTGERMCYVNETKRLVSVYNSTKRNYLINDNNKLLQVPSVCPQPYMNGAWDTYFQDPVTQVAYRCDTSSDDFGAFKNRKVISYCGHGSSGSSGGSSGGSRGSSGCANKKKVKSFTINKSGKVAGIINNLIIMWTANEMGIVVIICPMRDREIVIGSGGACTSDMNFYIHTDEESGSPLSLADTLYRSGLQPDVVIGDNTLTVHFTKECYIIDLFPLYYGSTFLPMHTMDYVMDPVKWADYTTFHMSFEHKQKAYELSVAKEKFIPRFIALANGHQEIARDLIEISTEINMDRGIDVADVGDIPDVTSDVNDGRQVLV